MVSIVPSCHTWIYTWHDLTFPRFRNHRSLTCLSSLWLTSLVALGLVAGTDWSKSFRKKNVQLCSVSVDVKKIWYNKWSKASRNSSDTFAKISGKAHVRLFEIAKQLGCCNNHQLSHGPASSQSRSEVSLESVWCPWLQYVFGRRTAHESMSIQWFNWAINTYYENPRFGTEISSLMVAPIFIAVLCTVSWIMSMHQKNKSSWSGSTRNFGHCCN